MKYKITLGGRGADIWIHRINEEQHRLLKEGDVVRDKIEMDDIAKILNKEMVDESDEVYTGVYDSGDDDVVIQVFNESDEMIFDSLEDKDWAFDDELKMEYDNYEFIAEEEEPMFFVESYSKGTFFSFEVETDEFDPYKLSPVITEINERFELITGLCYDGQVLEKEFDDYWGKGYYYHLT